MTNEVILAGAAAIANARGNRRGVPTITNILDVLPARLREECIEDATAALQAMDQLRLRNVAKEKTS